MSMNKLYKMWRISFFITIASVLSDSVGGSQQKGVCFKSNAFVDKIIVNNILGLGFNGSMVETLLKMTDRVISSDSDSIFKSDTFRKSQTWFNDVETGYNEMRQDVRQLKESFSSFSAQIKDFGAAQIRKDVRKLKQELSEHKTLEGENCCLDTLAMNKELMKQVTTLSSQVGSLLSAIQDMNATIQENGAIVRDLQNTDCNRIPVYHLQSSKGGYRMTFSEAKAACLADGAAIATYEQLVTSWKLGLEQCSCGWLADGTSRYPMHDNMITGCGGRAGIHKCGDLKTAPAWNLKFQWDVYCIRKTIQSKSFIGK